MLVSHNGSVRYAQKNVTLFHIFLGVQSYRGIILTRRGRPRNSICSGSKIEESGRHGRLGKPLDVMTNGIDSALFFLLLTDATSRETTSISQRIVSCRHVVEGVAFVGSRVFV